MGSLLDRFVGNIGPAVLMVSTFFWSWFDLVPFGPTLADAAGVPADPLDLAASLLVSAVALLALTCSRALRERLLKPRAFAACSLAFGTLGTVLAFVGLFAGVSALELVGTVLTGFYQAVGIIVCGSVTMCQGKTNALIHMASCLPFNIVFVLLGMFLQPGAAVVLCAALPLLSALSFKVYLVRGDNLRRLASVTCEPAGVAAGSRPAEPHFGADFRPGAAGSPAPAPACARRLLPYALLLLLITLSFGLVNCRVVFFGTPGVPAALTDYASLFTRGVVAVVVFVEYVFRSRQPYTILRAALFLMAACLLALALAPEGASAVRLACFTLFYAGYAIFDLVIWAVVIIVRRGVASSLQRFACAVMSVDQIGIFLGTILGLAPFAQAATPVVLGLAGAALALLAAVILSERNAVQDGLAVAVIEDEPDRRPAGSRLARRPEREGASGSPGDAREEAVSAAGMPGELARAVEPLAARFFLTEKETDVLGYLLCGRSVPYVAEALTVSQNTVKTHVRHIYAKLDVHNRQELIDLLDAER